MQTQPAKRNWIAQANAHPRLMPALAVALAAELGAVQHRARQPLQALRLALDALETPDQPATQAEDGIALGHMAQACVTEMVDHYDKTALAVKLLRRLTAPVTRPVAMKTLQPDTAMTGPLVLMDVEVFALAKQILAPESNLRWRHERGGIRIELTSPLPAQAPLLAGLCIGALKGAAYRPWLRAKAGYLCLGLWVVLEG